MASSKSPRSRSRSRISSSSKKKSDSPSCEASNVLLYYPQLIGYMRVIFMLSSLYFARSDWKACLGCYCVAFGGDVVDGFVARKFDQSSSFGATLDMVTDRVSTAGFLCMLASLMPEYAFYLALLAVLDIGSHWFHMVSVSGGAGHKSEQTLRDRNPVLRWYYGIYVLFGYCCVGAEFFYICLYAYHFTQDMRVLNFALYVCGPACALKNFINIVQMSSACYAIAENDAVIRNERDKKGK
eukprot:GSChrysophyteH1.ASY1.ANO1.2809.1 assembled CDS